MSKTLIYDGNNFLLPLEVEIIRTLINLRTLPTTRLTVERLKSAWLEDRMEEMQMVFFHHHHRRFVDDETFYKVRNLSHELDKPLYRSIVIPEQFRCRYATLEIKYNDIYLRFD